LVLQVKDGVNLNDLDSSPGKAFLELTHIMKAQDGFVRHYWVRNLKPLQHYCAEK
jgi:hypothetical protein